LARRLAGDLDNIILCAMRKKPERRYASVERLAEDVERHLAYRPVRARPDSPGYRAAKFVQRNRLAITLAGGAVGMVAGLAAIATYQARAGRQEVASELAAAETQLGDLLLAQGDRAGALDAYRKAKAASETGIAGNVSAERRRKEVTRKIDLLRGTTQR